MLNLAQLLFAAFEKEPDKVAISDEEGEITWSELYRLALIYKNQLLSRGIKRGQCVGIFTDHNIEQVVAIFGIAMADGVFTVISPNLKTQQIKHQIADADLEMIMVAGERLIELNEILVGRPTSIIEVDRKTAINSDVELCPPAAANIPADVACLIYTSGSTGNPKGVVVPGKTLLDGARIVSGYLKLNKKDVLLSLLPFGFDYGLNQLLSATYVNAKLVLQRFTFPQQVMQTIAQEKITGFAAVPSMWGYFLNSKLLSANHNYDLASLRYITTAGGKHPKEILIGIDKIFPNKEVIIMYGLTESFRSTYLPSDQRHLRYGSIGKAVPEVEILVLNDDGQPCSPGEKGELHHRGAFITYGYLNSPDLTKEKFVNLEKNGNGCLPEIIVRSGDIVSLDDEGFIYFHERKDAQIKSSGYRISPTQIEDVALSLPDIRQAAAFAIDDIETGEVICLAYSTYTGASIDTKSATKILKERLPNYSLPKLFKHFENIPITANGKTDYRALKSAEKT